MLFVAGLLLTGAPVDELGGGGTGGVDVAGGTKLSPRSADKPPSQFISETYPELAADGDTTEGVVGLEIGLTSMPEEVKIFEEETGGVPGAERL